MGPQSSQDARRIVAFPPRGAKQEVQTQGTHRASAWGRDIKGRKTRCPSHRLWESGAAAENVTQPAAAVGFDMFSGSPDIQGSTLSR